MKPLDAPVAALEALRNSLSICATIDWLRGTIHIEAAIDGKVIASSTDDLNLASLPGALTASVVIDGEHHDVVWYA